MIARKFRRQEAMLGKRDGWAISSRTSSSMLVPTPTTNAQLFWRAVAALALTRRSRDGVNSSGSRSCFAERRLHECSSLQINQRRLDMKKTKIALAAVIAASITTPALATIDAWFGAAVKVAPPADVRLNQSENNAILQAFDERQCVQLPMAGLQTDQGMIAGGTLVS